MLDRMKQELATIIEAMVGRRLLYSYHWVGTVASQNSDGSLEIVLDDSRVSGTGHDNIVVRHGMPGVMAEIEEGQRVVLVFEGGDPDKPFVIAYDRGPDNIDQLDIDAQTTINLGSGDQPAARETDNVNAGYLIYEPTTMLLYYAIPTPGNPNVPLTYAPITVNTTSPVPPAPGQLPATALAGAITSGSSKVNIED